MLTLVASGIGVVRFSTNAPVLVIALALVAVNSAFGFKMLYAAMREIQSLARIANRISNGNYDVITPVNGKNEMNTLIEVFNVMACRLKQHDLHLRHKVYQTAVLKEISERITASLDESEAIEIIAGSLGKVVPYSMASYLTLRNNGAALLKCHIEESVSKAFAEETKRIMLHALTALGGPALTEAQIEKTICYGIFFDEEAKSPVRSHFTLPLYVNDMLAGIITVSSATPNL